MTQLRNGRGTHQGADAFLRQQEALSIRAGSVAAGDGAVVGLESALVHHFTPASGLVAAVSEVYFIPLRPLPRDITISHARVRFAAGVATSRLSAALYSRESRELYRRVGQSEVSYNGAAAGVQTRELTGTLRLPAESNLAYAVVAETAAPNVGCGQTDISLPFRVQLLATTTLPTTFLVTSLQESTRTLVPWVSYMSATVEESY